MWCLSEAAWSSNLPLKHINMHFIAGQRFVALLHYAMMFFSNYCPCLPFLFIECNEHEHLLLFADILICYGLIS